MFLTGSPNVAILSGVLRELRLAPGAYAQSSRTRPQRTPKSEGENGESRAAQDKSAEPRTRLILALSREDRPQATVGSKGLNHPRAGTVNPTRRRPAEKQSYARFAPVSPKVFSVGSIERAGHFCTPKRTKNTREKISKSDRKGTTL